MEPPTSGPHPNSKTTEPPRTVTVSGPVRGSAIRSTGLPVDRDPDLEVEFYFTIGVGGLDFDFDQVLIVREVDGQPASSPVRPTTSPTTSTRASPTGSPFRVAMIVAPGCPDPFTMSMSIVS